MLGTADASDASHHRHPLRLRPSSLRTMSINITPVLLSLIIIIKLMSTMMTAACSPSASLPHTHVVNLEQSKEHQALTIIDRVANKPLRVKTPFVTSCMDQLMAAITCALGTHLRVLATSKQRPNSHGITAESGKDGITWTWPNLTRNNIEWKTSRRMRCCENTSRTRDRAT